jgi:hypothetical protein
MDLAWAQVGIVAQDHEYEDDHYPDRPDSSEEDFVVLRAVRHRKYRRYGDDEFSYDYSIVQLNGTSTLQHVSLLHDESLLNETAHPYLTAMTRMDAARLTLQGQLAPLRRLGVGEQRSLRGGIARRGILPRSDRSLAFVHIRAWEGFLQLRRRKSDHSHDHHHRR